MSLGQKIFSFQWIAKLKELANSSVRQEHELQSIRAEIRQLATDIFFAQPRDPKHIATIPTHIYSQNYEDAIIAEIFSRIGERSRCFVEIGVETGIECNTRALLERGWSGVWIDADARALALARSNMTTFLDSGALKIVEATVTKENVQPLITAAIGETAIDFLSVDVDYNTSHLWSGITSPARVSCIEYNASIPPSVEWEVPYDPHMLWDGSNWFGASLKTLERIGREKHLALVGCDFHGVNAFFVAERDCADKFLTPYSSEQHFEPPRYALTGHRGHPARSKSSSVNPTIS